MAAIQRILQSNSFLALLDQVFVSGSRFAISLVIGRHSGAEGLGAYVLSFAILIFAAVTQESVISRPYLVFAARMRAGSRSSYAGSTLVQMVALAILFMLIVSAAVTIGNRLGWIDEALFSALSASSVALSGILVWEFSRRFAFAAMDVRSALILDVFVVVLQFLAVAGLAWSGLLTAGSAIMTIGLVALLGGVGALLIWRLRFRVNRRRLYRDSRRNWRFGKWLFYSNASVTVQAYFVPWVLAMTVSAKATGILTACHTIVLLSNPVLLGVSNWLRPAAAIAFAESGTRGVAALTRRVGLAMFGGTMAFALAMSLVGEQLLVFLYGAEFSGYGHIVALTSLAAVGFGVSVVATSGLAALDNTPAIFRGSLVGMVVTIVAFFPAVWALQVTGASLTVVLGSLIAAGLQLFYLVMQLQRHDEIAASSPFRLKWTKSELNCTVNSLASEPTPK